MLLRTIRLLLVGEELSIVGLLCVLLDLSLRVFGLLLSNDSDDRDVGVLVKSLLVVVLLLPLLLLLLWCLVTSLSLNPFVVIIAN